MNTQQQCSIGSKPEWTWRGATEDSPHHRSSINSPLAKKNGGFFGGGRPGGNSGVDSHVCTLVGNGTATRQHSLIKSKRATVDAQSTSKQHSLEEVSIGLFPPGVIKSPEGSMLEQDSQDVLFLPLYDLVGASFP